MMLNLLKNIKMPKHSQHFMTDKETLRRICKYAKLNKDDIVLEIGSGTGNLTFEIAKFARVHAIEKDEELIEELKKIKENLNIQNIHIIHADALKIEFPRFNKVAANLPYAISRKITLKLLKYKFDRGILTYQKEFAEKLTARVGNINYKFITAAAQTFWDIKILSYVFPSAFSPAPNVKSAIIQIKPKFNQKFEFDEKYIENYIVFIRNLFNHRNKKIKEINKRVYELNPEELLELYENQEVK